MSAFTAIAERNLEGLMESLDDPKQDPNQMVNGITLLGHAIMFGYAEAVGTLLLFGANKRLKVWETPPRGWAGSNHHLLLASVLPSRDIVNMLLSGDPALLKESRTRKEADAMMVAARNGMSGNVRQMFQAVPDYDPTRQDKDGKDLLDYAIAIGDRDLEFDVAWWQQCYHEGRKAQVINRCCWQDNVLKLSQQHLPLRLPRAA